jgi:hypothetical protein
MAPTAQSVDLHIQLHGTGSPTRTRVSFTCDRNAAKLGLAGGVFQVEYIQWSWKLSCSFSYRRQKSHLFWCSFWVRSPLRCRQIRLVGRRSFSLSDSLNGQSRVSCDSKEKVIHHKGMSRQADVNLSLLGDHRDAVGNRLRVAGLVNGELHR